ncbi:MAG: ATP-binding protein [Gammaproteobacteria bacterium]
MSITFEKYKTSSQKRIILSFLLVFFISILTICILMYKIFSNNLSENLHTRALEVIDIVDYMAQTSGESPELIRGINTLAANRDIKLIIVRIDEPPVVIASNKAALIGLPTNKIFSNDTSSQSFSFDSNNDEYTAISSIWLENKFSNGQFTKAHIGVVFNTYKTRILLQEQILQTAIYLILTTIFAIGLVYFLTNKYIFQPLEIINSTLNKNDINKEFSPIAFSTNDEIGSVAKTLNQLFTDIYESKRTLRENTERYDLALQGTKVGLVDWNIATNDLYYSSSLMQVLGIAKNIIKPSIGWFEERTHPDDRETAQASLISHLKFNTEYDVEGRLRHENGDYIWMRVRGQAVRDDEGKAIRMVGYYVDISNRKANEHLMNSLYLLSADATLSLNKKINCILEEGVNYLGLDCGIICNVNENCLSVKYLKSPKKYQIYAGTVFALSDTFCSHTVKENDMLAIHDIKNSALNYLPEHTESGINCYIGTPLYVHGRIYGTVSFSDYKTKLRPFTEQEKSFIRLVAQWIGNEMMRSQYIDYLHETESRLEDAVEELTNTNSELESFTYVASHDLQEPLRMITNFTGLLEANYSKNLDGTALDYLKILSKSASQMRILIKGLLDYAHTNRENEKIENIDLNHILKNIYTNLEKQICEAKPEIIVNNLPSIQANKASIISLLQNLVSNAIKFQTEGSKAVIEVNAYQQKDSCVISISDNGIGIETEYQEKVFEPFKRLHAKNEYIGTGIGLAVCKKIVTRMGGTMWVESEKGTGSTFFVSIPNLITQTGKAA